MISISSKPIEIKANRNQSIINPQKARDSRRRLERGIIKPAKEDVHIETANEHTAEPIKSLDDISRISKYLLDNKRYRDNMLFIVGINFGLRVSDLLQLRFSHLIDDDFTFRTTFPILEKKTKNTRKVKRNRYISINDAVIEAVTIYLEHTECKLDDYLFKSESNNKGYSSTDEKDETDNRNKPMSRMSVDRILKEIGNTLKLTNKMSTHTLRKTFAYHQMAISNNDPRKLLLLQKTLGHSSVVQTLDYIGITGDEIREAYMSLNLGWKNHYLIDSSLEEDETAAITA